MDHIFVEWFGRSGAVSVAPREANLLAVGSMHLESGCMHSERKVFLVLCYLTSRKIGRAAIQRCGFYYSIMAPTSKDALQQTQHEGRVYPAKLSQADLVSGI